MANNLRQARIKANMSQSQLASAVNVSQGSIAMYESGKREPSLDVAKRLASVLNCSIDYLCGHTATVQ